MVVHLVNVILGILVNLVNVVHLDHLAKWTLDIWVKLDMFHYLKDNKIFHRNINFHQNSDHLFQSVREKVQSRKKNLSCVTEKF